jgi:multidrug efflux pump
MSFAQGGLFIPIILVAHALLGLSGIVWSMTITEALTCLIGIGLFTLSKGKREPEQKRDMSPVGA